MEDNGKVIIVYETLWQSIARDGFSFLTMCAMIGLGVFLQSTAMQWVGAIIWFIWLIGRATQYAKKQRCSFEEARRRLTDWEQEHIEKSLKRERRRAY